MNQTLFVNASLATMDASEAEYGWVGDGAIAVRGERIAWAGSADLLPADYADWRREDLAGAVVTPGLIDCHTHLIFGGDRAGEFELRLKGATYEQIAAQGGGILSTVSATRQASESQLVELALPRLDQLLAEGVTTIEIKSGYGLDIETELRMLSAARRLGELRPVQVRTTYLGAHAVPPEYQRRPDAYLDEVCLPGLDRAAELKLADAVDGFCERIAFDRSQIERLFSRASDLGLPVKLHAEQLSWQGGAQLAAQFGGLSADHLEYATDQDAEAMAGAGTVAVMLPGAYYTLRQDQLPPVAGLRQRGVPMAVATDCNPGSSPLTSLLLAMNMACTLFRMTPAEALAGVTRNGATALGLQDVGQIVAGNRADLVVWDIRHPAELAYRMGANPIVARYFGGSKC